jgi:hypothetical protein
MWDNNIGGMRQCRSSAPPISSKHERVEGGVDVG